MDPENKFDSDASESWSLIDMNYAHSSENKINGNTGNENPSREVMSGEKSSASSGEPGKNGIPGKIAKDDVSIGSSLNDPKNQQDFQLLFKSKTFGNSDAGTKSEPNTGEGEKVDPETKDLDEDTDGISVISESEYNDIKAANYDSDDKGSESEGDDNSNDSNKKETLDTNEDEDSEETENPEPRTSLISSMLRIIMGLVFTVVTCIAIGHLLGVYDSQEAASNMVQALKKLQTENFMHTRLRQISEAVFGKPNEGHEMMGKSLPCEDYDTDCIRAELAKPENRVGKDDTPLSFFRHRDNIDLSIPLHHPKNLVILQEILSGNEVLVLRKPGEPVEPFNLTKYIKDLIKAQQIKYDDPETMGKATGFLKFFRMSPKKSAKEGQNGKEVELDGKEEKKNVEKPDGKGCQKDGKKVEEGENRKENCLAIHRKDMSQFRWFLLHGRPKCSKADMENDINGCGAEYSYKLDEEYTKNSNAAMDELKTIMQKHNALMERNRILKEARNRRSAVPLTPTKLKKDVDEYGDAKLRNKYLHFLILKNDKQDIEEVIRQEREKRPKAVSSEVVRKDQSSVSGNYVDKYLKHFKGVIEDIKKNNGKIKECIKKDGGKCLDKPKKNKENNSTPNENRKKHKEKRARYDGEKIDKRGRGAHKFDKKDHGEHKSDKKDHGEHKSDKKDHGEHKSDKKDHGEHKSDKKDQVPDDSKGKAKSRPKKWKMCSIKPPTKCGNESKCANCSSKSGDWFSKWTEGRERGRRDLKTSEWQFERAKGRAHSRAGDAFWQFTRAYGRQNRRMYPYTRKRKVRQYTRKGYNFKSHSWE